jgi:hypothetical protein
MVSEVHGDVHLLVMSPSPARPTLGARADSPKGLRTMLLNWPAFVLQRRVNIPVAAAERALCDPHLFRPGAVFNLAGESLTLRIDGDFKLAFPPFGIETTSWCAPASICGRRGRRVQALELEVNAWDHDSTELLVRPRGGRVHQWSGRRMARYFRMAHAAADTFAKVVASFDRMSQPEPTVPGRLSGVVFRA